MVPTVVYYTNTIDPKPKIDELDNMGNAEKRRFWKNRGKQILKIENEKMGRQFIHLKKAKYHF